MPILLDTSVLIRADSLPEDEAAISVASVCELHFGVLNASDETTRARRLRRLTAVEAQFDPIPFDVVAARECGRLHAEVARRGRQPRRRALDLVIAATASVLGLPLLTLDAADFQFIADLVDVRTP